MKATSGLRELSEFVMLLMLLRTSFVLAAKLARMKSPSCDVATPQMFSPSLCFDFGGFLVGMIGKYCSDGSDHEFLWYSHVISVWAVHFGL